MNIYILRHGIAVDPTEPGVKSDANRQLTPEGERKVRRVAKAMKAMGLSFDMILASPCLRARKTAETVTDVLRAQKMLALTDHLAPDGDPKKLIEQLNAEKPASDDVLLVGHEPYLSRLIALLISGNTNLAIELKKSGLCRLEAEPLRYGRCAILHWLLTPKQMVLMS